MNKKLVYYVAREFRRRELTKVVIVYDMDDILWSLMTVVCQFCDIEYARATRIFSIRDNDQLTHAEQTAILDAFANPKIFERIQFYPGAADIMRPAELGAIIKINSNAFTSQIANLKRDQLLAAIPGLHPSNIQMNIVNPSTAKHKVLDPDMTIFIDDSPHNIASSSAIINLMPRTIGWTSHPGDIQKIAGKRIHWEDNLLAINTLIYDITKQIICPDTV